MSGAGQITGGGGFTPVTSIKEAEDWAMKNIDGIKNVNFGKYSIEQANSVLDEISNLQVKFGKLGDMESIEVVGKRQKFAGRMQGGKNLQLRVDITDAYNKRAFEMGLTKSKPGLAGLVDHEIGHTMTPHIFDVSVRPPKMTKFGEGLDKFFKANKDKIKTEISDYAATARHEFVAEVFALRENNTAPKWAIKFMNEWNI